MTRKHYPLLHPCNDSALAHLAVMLAVLATIVGSGCAALYLMINTEIAAVSILALIG